MQGVTVRWVGQSFALPRCNASSSENKVRTRRTKEERRTMAEAFIKKYQSSNSGKFPSLNLTHKEVGGSFYTVREIVRDIIQENKVLGPGNPSSKLLNLEYYSDEEEDKGSFLDVHGNTSLSTVNGKDQVQNDVISSMKDHEISIDQDNALMKSVILSNTYLKENSFWQVPQDEPNFAENFRDGIFPHEEVIKTAAKESNVHVLTEKKDDTSFVETELKNEDIHSKISPTSQFLEDRTSISECASTGSIPGDNVNDQSKFCPQHAEGGVFPLVTDILGHESSSETPVLFVSDTSEIFESAHAVHLTAEPYENGAAIDKSVSDTSENFESGHKVHLTAEPYEDGASIDKSVTCTSEIFESGHKEHVTAEPYEDGAAIDKSDLESAGLNNINSTFRTSETSFIANNGVIPFIPFSDVDVAESRSVDNEGLQAIRSSALGPAENDIHMVDKFSSFVDAIKESESVSSKFLKPIIEDADHSKIKVEKQSDSASTVNDGGIMSSSNENTMKESEMLEMNPLWAAIKSLVSSFIKFWSE